MNVLITGGCGFIGQNLAIACYKKGWKVAVVDRDLSNWHRWKDQAPGVNVICSDYASVSNLHSVRSGNFEIIFHLAALPQVAYSCLKPGETTYENVAKMAYLLEAATANSANNCRRFVFTSSAAVYGSQPYCPTPEYHVTVPASPYALQKKHGEEMCELFSHMHSFDTVCLRLFNIFGEGQLATNAYSGVIASWCKSLKNGVSLRKDGSGIQTRDMCHVDNAVSALILAATSPRSFRGDIYNVGTGISISNNDILDFLSNRHRFEIETAPIRDGDVLKSQADIIKIEEELGYKVSVDFETGMNKTLKWWGLD